MLWASTFLLLCFVSAIFSQQSPPDVSPCALSCLAQTTPIVGCSLDDTPCQCASKYLPELSAACMVANCTMEETQLLSKASASNCNLPFQDKSDLVIVSFIVITITTGILVLLRVGSRYFDEIFAHEDHIILVAFLMSISSNSTAIICTYLALAAQTKAQLSTVSYEGLGKHVYSLQEGDLLIILQHFYIGENIYVIVLGLVKISILTFYLRIFQHHYLFRIFVKAQIFLIILTATIISTLTFFQCYPIKYFWDKDVKNGACVNQNALAYANSAVSIAQDIAIIILPIPIVAKMNMDIKRKLGVGFMFSVGGFGCIVSIIRLQSLLVFGTSIDPTWDYVPVTIWTALELSAAIICSSLPALRSLAQKIFHSFTFSLLHSRSESSDRSSINFRQSWRFVSSRDTFVELPRIECADLNIKWPGEDKPTEERLEDIRHPGPALPAVRHHRHATSTVDPQL